MPHTIPIASGYELHFRYTWNGQQMENVYGYRHTAPASPAECSAMANAWAVQNQTAQRALLTSDVVLREVLVRARNIPPTIIEGQYVFPPNTFGTNSGQVGDPAAAIQLLLRTGFGGRSYRGAKRYGPLSANDMANGSILSGTVSRLATAAFQLLLPVLGNWFLAVLSDKLASVFDVASIVLLDNFVDSQKTRLIDHGA